MESSARFRPAFSIIWKRFGPVSSVAMRSTSRICAAMARDGYVPLGTLLTPEEAATLRDRIIVLEQQELALKG